MITPHCDKCLKELTEPGGLAFSPPLGFLPEFEHTSVAKFHLCTRCWAQFCEWLAQPPQP